MYFIFLQIIIQIECRHGCVLFIYLQHNAKVSQWSQESINKLLRIISTEAIHGKVIDLKWNQNKNKRFWEYVYKVFYFTIEIFYITYSPITLTLLKIFENWIKFNSRSRKQSIVTNDRQLFSKLKKSWKSSYIQFDHI